jgi:hypothetical protein
VLSILSVGIMPKYAIPVFQTLKNTHLLIEDISENAAILIDQVQKFDRSIKVESTPLTSFLYQSKLYFKDCKK